MAVKSFLILIFLFAFVNVFCQPDSRIYSQRVITVKEKKHIGFLNHYGFILLNSKNDTILKQEGGYHDWEYKDFNKDGFKDIFLEIASNTPSSYDLYLYDPLRNRFQQVPDFESFPAPAKLDNTKYYYSYHRNGCADYDWVSDLFSIKDFKIVQIGKIFGNGCGNDSINDRRWIEIFKINKNDDQDKQLLEKLPYGKNIPKFEDKWDFIKRYWSKNYSKFAN